LGNWKSGKDEMSTRVNVSERRQKGIKKRKRRVGEEKSMKTQKATIKEEIDADMPKCGRTNHNQEK